MHIIAAVLLALHGVGHLVGFRSAFWPTPIDLQRRSSLVSKLDGLVWLVLALGFVGSAGLLLFHQAGWTVLLLMSAAGSALMCLLSWPEARLGLLIDVVLLVLVLLLSPTSTSGV
ncbi:MAG TPA: hypothetical protein VHP33_10900 [Polyangiaceae bacterium]|nr:hypothetical protein [Polyangiaceae bacterium]